MNESAIASAKSWEVLQRQLAERDGRDVPKVTAPVITPATFGAEVLVGKRKP